MTLKEAYVTMKIYWDTEEPDTPEAIKEVFEKFYNSRYPFKIFVTSVGGIKRR